MIITESQNIAQKNTSEEKVCNLNYLTEMVNGKKNLISDIMDTFLKQAPQELQSINEAIKEKNFSDIKRLTHKMKSSVSVMGISSLKPVLEEMMDLGEKATNIEKIKELDQTLNSISKKAIEEIEKEKLNYV